jgi:hypothetical protein
MASPVATPRTAATTGSEVAGGLAKLGIASARAGDGVAAGVGSWAGSVLGAGGSDEVVEEFGTVRLRSTASGACVGLDSGAKGAAGTWGSAAGSFSWLAPTGSGRPTGDGDGDGGSAGRGSGAEAGGVGDSTAVGRFVDGSGAGGVVTGDSVVVVVEAGGSGRGTVVSSPLGLSFVAGSGSFGVSAGGGAAGGAGVGSVFSGEGEAGTGTVSPSPAVN